MANTSSPIEWTDATWSPAAAHKHAINLQRQWQFDLDKGFDKHVEVAE